MADNTWNCDEDREDLWTTDPRRAALLAYLEVVGLWHDQVQDGQYRGIPAVHRLPSEARAQSSDESSESGTMRSRPARFTRDSSAGQWTVPPEIRERWLKAA